MFTSATVTAALGLKPDLLGNLRQFGYLRIGTKIGRAYYHDPAEVLQLGIALKLAKLIGQGAGFALVFDDDSFRDELLAAIDSGTPLVLVHGHPPYLTWRDAGDVVQATADMVTQVRVAEWARALLGKLEAARRAEAATKAKPPHERRHGGRRDTAQRWADYERGIQSMKGRRKA